MGVMAYSVEPMDSEVWMLVSVWTFAERDATVPVELILEGQMMSLVSVAVVVTVHLVPVASEVRG